MSRSLLCLLFLLLVALRASADVLVFVLDKELGTPLEGVKVQAQGSDRPLLTDGKGQAVLPCLPGARASSSRPSFSATRPSKRS